MMIAEMLVELKTLERKIFTLCCHMGCDMLKEVLENYDKFLLKNRDKSIYRNKGLRKIVLKTIMGEVEFLRTMYETKDENGTKRYVYLLDEHLGITGNGYFSQLLTELIVKASCENSYRDVAAKISEMTRQTISHTAVWDVVQKTGEKLDEKEQINANLATKNQLRGKIESQILFEEQDGVYLNLQGEDRKTHGKSKEMKVAIAYDGAVEKGKNRYELTNKVAVANFENARKFTKRKEGVIAENYNIDEINMRILNGDGANWIRNSQIDDTVHFQLDPFHCSQAILRNVSDLNARKIILNLLHSQQIDKLLDVIEAYANSTENQKEKEKYLKLLTYFSSNKDGLNPYYKRGLKLPKPPKGKEYRHLGAMESNIFTIIGNRMKGRRACWSIKGGNNLARLLCLKTTGRLSETLQKISTLVLPETYSQNLEITLSAAKIPEISGKKGYDGIKQFSIPSTMPWLKDIAAQRPLC